MQKKGVLRGLGIVSVIAAIMLLLASCPDGLGGKDPGGSVPAEYRGRIFVNGGGDTVEFTKGGVNVKEYGGTAVNYPVKSVDVDKDNNRITFYLSDNKADNYIVGDINGGIIEAKLGSTVQGSGWIEDDDLYANMQTVPDDLRYTTWYSLSGNEVYLDRGYVVVRLSDGSSRVYKISNRDMEGSGSNRRVTLYLNNIYGGYEGPMWELKAADNRVFYRADTGLLSVTINKEVVAGGLRKATGVKYYEAVFYLNDGSGEVYDQKRAYPNAKIELPAENPQRAGYDFTGWYTEAACVTKYDADRSLTRNVSIYAGWQEVADADFLYYYAKMNGNYSAVYVYGVNRNYNYSLVHEKDVDAENRAYNKDYECELNLRGSFTRTPSSNSWGDNFRSTIYLKRLKSIDLKPYLHDDFSFWPIIPSIQPPYVYAEEMYFDRLDNERYETFCDYEAVKEDGGAVTFSMSFEELSERYRFWVNKQEQTRAMTASYLVYTLTLMEESRDMTKLRIRDFQWNEEGNCFDWIELGAKSGIMLEGRYYNIKDFSVINNGL